MKAVIAVVLAAGALASGAVTANEANYKASCAACHEAGVSGAPKLGDKAAWAPRIAKGMDALMKTSIEGSKANPAMMPRGGSKLDDAALKSVVEYMVSKAK